MFKSIINGISKEEVDEIDIKAIQEAEEEIELRQLMEIIDLINIGTDVIKKIKEGASIRRRIEYAYKELEKHKDNPELKMFTVETTDEVMLKIASKLGFLPSSKKEKEEKKQPEPMIYNFTAEQETKDLFMKAIRESVKDLPSPILRSKLIQEAEQIEMERIIKDREYAKKHGYKFIK